MGTTTNIEWNEAIQKEKQQKIEKEEFDKEYKENVSSAADELYDAMGSEYFKGWEEMEDIASMYGVEPDDLINELI